MDWYSSGIEQETVLLSGFIEGQSKGSGGAVDCAWDVGIRDAHFKCD